MGIKIKTAEQLRAENLAKIENFKLMDETYMNAFFNGQAGAGTICLAYHYEQGETNSQVGTNSKAAEKFARQIYHA